MDEELDTITRNKLHINTFHGLCRQFYRYANIPFTNGIPRVAGIPITTDLNEWKRDAGILFSTFAAFKGLEADAIVLLVSRASPPSPNDFYVASSRAKHLLTIIETMD